MFLLPRTRPLELDAQHVRALRPSLNTPVVATPELPVGPACAAILVHVEPGHGLQISVGVRSLGCGSVALYGFDAPIGAAVVAVALDAALSFAESMGFLFDEDVVGDDAGSREKAVLRWRELIGDAVLPTAQASPSPGTDLFANDGDELTDPPEPGPFEESSPSGISNEAIEFKPAAPAARELALSKFRVQPKSDEVEGTGAATESGARGGAKHPLARIRLSKKRTGEPVLDAQRAWLLRLLTSF